MVPSGVVATAIRPSSGRVMWLVRDVLNDLAGQKNTG